MRTRRVHFDNVTVYYFSRRQGFTSVPSQGGSTLGMSNRHSGVRQYSLGEFALEQERIHRDMLRDHLKEEKLNSMKLKVLVRIQVVSQPAVIGSRMRRRTIGPASSGFGQCRPSLQIRICP